MLPTVYKQSEKIRLKIHFRRNYSSTNTGLTEKQNNKIEMKSPVVF